MIKNTVIALVAAASLVAVAAPAYAAPFGDGSPEMREFIADSIVTRLQQQGVNVSSVEEWGDLVRAFVTLEDGRQVMQFYTPGSLQPVS